MHSTEIVYTDPYTTGSEGRKISPGHFGNAYADSNGHPGRVIAIIDLGSNSVRLLLLRLLPDGTTTVLNRIKHMVRLGENSFQKRMLQETAMRRTLAVLYSFAGMCETYGAQEVLAIATAAVRDAENGWEFIQRVHRKTGLNFHVISGKEEARRIYLGVSSGLPTTVGLRLFMDIGGGSTELTVGSSADYSNLDSLKLGCVRLTNAFLEGHTGPVSSKLFKKMQRDIRRVAAHALNRIRNFDIFELVGSSGTIQALHVIAYRLEHGVEPEQDQDIMTLDGLRRAAKHICSLTLQGRQKIPGVSMRRAQVLVAGAAILLTLQEELGIASLRVSTRNLQDGILIDYLRRSGVESAKPDNLREHSVLQLARRCEFEEEHARHIAKLALQIHDSAVDCGCITLDHQGRELLYYAALLHDIGIFISYARHADHSYYLIHNSELLGFHESETNFIALLTLFHSKKPSKKHKAFAQYDCNLQKRLRVFSLFLSLAENMDRLHCRHVHESEFYRDDNGLMLRVTSRNATPVEMDAVIGMEKRLRKTFKEEIRVQFCTTS